MPAKKGTRAKSKPTPGTAQAEAADAAEASHHQEAPVRGTGMAVQPTASRGDRRPPRFVFSDITPAVDGGLYPVKRVVGEPVVVDATVFADGHDRVVVNIAHRPPDNPSWVLEPMVPTNPGLDRWQGSFTPLQAGDHPYRVVAWVDHYGSWVDGVRRKREAGVDIGSDLLTGSALIEALAAASPAPAPMGEAAECLRLGDLHPLDDPGVEAAARQCLRIEAADCSDPIPVAVEPERAQFSTWYELFPRSWSTDPGTRPHGTFADLAAQLGYVADMGFDVLYLPPIHPIGRAFRKGRDNTEAGGPGDPGSPWAIGGPEGGHTAINPELGGIEDFRRLVAAAESNGLSIALDFALQCSPDHPWVTEHPEWFRHRPDGTIQYAENPPKKYQDIYPLDFECDEWRALWDACRDIAVFWLDQGVRVFRVDNPHTKPFAFWRWLIGDLKARESEVVFLAEAFTRPAVMHQLAKVGFTLSYDYFPWRNSRDELVEYFSELSSPPGVEYFRPSSWPNTPDILTAQLRGAPRGQFAIRYVLAATLSPCVGIYGPAFELCANDGASNGKEEYAASEKYEIKRWNLGDPGSIRELIGEVNRIRFDQLAFRTLRTLRFHRADNPSLLVFSKTPHSGPGTDADVPHAATVLVVVNLDPNATQAGRVELDLGALGVDPGRSFEVHDLLADRGFEWSGPVNFVELRPHEQPAHIFRVTQR